MYRDLNKLKDDYVSRRDKDIEEAYNFFKKRHPGGEERAPKEEKDKLDNLFLEIIAEKEKYYGNLFKKAVANYKKHLPPGAVRILEIDKLIPEGTLPRYRPITETAQLFYAGILPPSEKYSLFKGKKRRRTKEEEDEEEEEEEEEEKEEEEEEEEEKPKKKFKFKRYTAFKLKKIIESESESENQSENRSETQSEHPSDDEDEIEDLKYLKKRLKDDPPKKK